MDKLKSKLEALIDEMYHNPDDCSGKLRFKYEYVEGVENVFEKQAMELLQKLEKGITRADLRYSMEWSVKNGTILVEMEFHGGDVRNALTEMYYG